MKETKKYHQKFRKEWCNDEQFKSWLLPVAGNDREAFCKLCKCRLAAKYFTLKSHMAANKHKKRLSEIYGNSINDWDFQEPEDCLWNEHFEDTDCDAERSKEDLVSKKIGQLLLKGFKMLAASCETCVGVLLEDKAGVELCVTCNLDKLQQQGGHRHSIGIEN